VLFNEPKLLKSTSSRRLHAPIRVSVLFNEPKLLKSSAPRCDAGARRFSALQRAEIAEITAHACADASMRFSALQRAEIAEILIAERRELERRVSVLFNEPKLLKCWNSEQLYCRNWMFQCSSTSRNC
jgi:hypothetical protein